MINMSKKIKLSKAYRELLEYVNFFYEPKDSPLELHVKESSDAEWRDIRPEGSSNITALSFNFDQSLPFVGTGRKIPDGLVNVSNVWGTDCIELAIGKSSYRIFAKSLKSKVSPIISSEIPGGYWINYDVLGGVWIAEREMPPTKQLEKLDEAFKKLKEHADLYYPIHKTNNLYPFIKLSFKSIEDGITYIGLKYLPDDGHGTSDASLDHMLFRQKPILNNDQAVVLGIYGGVKAYIQIEDVKYELIMDSRKKSKGKFC